MTSFFVFFGFVAVLLISLLRILVKKASPGGAKGIDAAALEQEGPRHAIYFPIVQRALCETDLQYLAERGSQRIAKRAKKERRHVAQAYLQALRGDFDRLMSLARAVAVLSPEVVATHEFERMRLGMKFSMRYRLATLALSCGLLSMPRLSGVSELVSGLAAQMDTALRMLGERAALAAELASPFDQRGANVA